MNEPILRVDTSSNPQSQSSPFVKSIDSQINELWQRVHDHIAEHIPEEGISINIYIGSSALTNLHYNQINQAGEDSFEFYCIANDIVTDPTELNVYELLEVVPHLESLGIIPTA